MTTGLNPCPKCKGVGEGVCKFPEQGFSRIICTNCGAKTELMDLPSQAKDAWNKGLVYGGTNNE